MLTKRTGFTLIELLVVIAIIAILAAILFPVFARARAKAFQTQCLSNIKNTALAYKIYTSDWLAYYPATATPLYICEAGKLDNPTPTGAVAPYVSDDDIMHCPLLRQWRRANQGETLRVAGSCFEMGYAFNAAYWRGDTSWTSKGCTDFHGQLALEINCGSATKTIAACASWIEDPGNTVLLVESWGDTEWTRYAGGQAWMCHDGWSGTNTYSASGSRFKPGKIFWGHNDGANYAFCDGHARWVMNPTAGSVIANAAWGDETSTPPVTNWWDIGPNSRELCERVTWLSDCACP